MRVENVGGLRLLACPDGGATNLFALDERDHFRREARLPVATSVIQAARMAPDGTIGFSAPCGEFADCHAFVRRPLPAGTPGAWRVVSLGGATAFWLLDGGDVVVLRDFGPSGRGKGRRLVTFTLDTPTGTRDLASRVRADDDPVKFVVDESGRMLLGYWVPKQDSTNWFAVAHHRLLPAPAPPQN